MRGAFVARPSFEALDEFEDFEADMGARPQDARQGRIPRGFAVNPDLRAMLQLFDFEHVLIGKPHTLFGSAHGL